MQKNWIWIIFLGIEKKIQQIKISIFLGGVFYIQNKTNIHIGAGRRSRRISSVLHAIFTITRKIKITKKNYFVFHSIQHIPHLSWKSYHFWGRGVCTSLEQGQYFFNQIDTKNVFHILNPEYPLYPLSNWHRLFGFKSIG